MEKKNKLGYTWYPKDWGNSEKVFELTLSERGLYRELIDMAMLNDNNTEVNSKVWQRKFGVTEKDLLDILKSLKGLNLIEFRYVDIDGLETEFVFIPSCEPRLNLVRGGSNGGKKSKKNKPLVKPTDKPLLSLDEKNDKPTINQIEIESKIKEIKKEILNSQSWIEQIAKNKFLTLEKCKDYLNRFLSDAELKDEIIELSDTKKHFVNWLNIELKKDIPDKEKAKRHEAPDLDDFRKWEG
jgi:hypothetical protein